MTNEELENEAEEYALGMMGNKYDEFCKLEQTYIDAHKKGCAEGRKEKWHDLRKDPNDLPKENGEYYGKVEYFGEQYRKIVFDVDRKRFDVTYIIAWCELPKFEE